jgi:hypothetical protein
MGAITTISDFDYLPSERKKANQGREVGTLPRIPV